MNPTFLFLLFFAAFGVAPQPSEPARTLYLRWEQPSSEETRTTAAVGVSDGEMQKAVRTLTRMLGYRGMEVSFGYYAAEHPNSDPQAVGRLWVNGVPVETLLDLSLPAGTLACPLTASQVVDAGVQAAGLSVAATERHGSRTFTVAPPHD